MVHPGTMNRARTLSSDKKYLTVWGVSIAPDVGVRSDWQALLEEQQHEWAYHRQWKICVENIFQKSCQF